MYLTIAEFDTVSYPQFTADVKKCNPLISESCIEDMWRDLVFPDRATEGSAGYDFRVPYDIILEPGESALIPTGMRCQIEEGWVLMLFPRSSMGFKYRMQLDNGTGIVDGDYIFAENKATSWQRSRTTVAKARQCTCERATDSCRACSFLTASRLMTSQEGREPAALVPLAIKKRR